jgi:hypothetical protein
MPNLFQGAGRTLREGMELQQRAMDVYISVLSWRQKMILFCKMTPPKNQRNWTLREYRVYPGRRNCPFRIMAQFAREFCPRKLKLPVFYGGVQANRLPPLLNPPVMGVNPLPDDPNLIPKANPDKQIRFVKYNMMHDAVFGNDWLKAPAKVPEL